MILCAIMIAITYDQRVLRTMHGIDKSCESCGSVNAFGGFQLSSVEMPLSAVPPRKVLTLNPYTTCFFLPAIKTLNLTKLRRQKKRTHKKLKKKKKKEIKIIFINGSNVPNSDWSIGWFD